MKNLLITTAFVVASTGAVAAQDSSDQIRAIVEQELATYEMDVDIDSLTDAQVSELYLVATSEDSSDKEEEFRSVLSEDNVMSEDETAGAAATQGATGAGMADVEGMERSQLAAAVEQSIASYGLDVDVDTLTDAQLSEIYLLETSSESDDMESGVSNQQRIEEIVGM